jgi:hypothetical protein
MTQRNNWTQLIDQVYAGVLLSQVRVLFRCNARTRHPSIDRQPQQISTTFLVSLSASEGQGLARRIKTYLRSTMSQVRLNNLMVLTGQIHSTYV